MRLKSVATDEPKDRLRATRTRLGLTRDQLAAKIGRASSTVRAHENGQNKIQPEMAVTYARELGISPSWLLYGTDDTPPPPPGPRTRPIPVVGQIWDAPHFFREGDEEVSDEIITVSLPEYDDMPDLAAYVMRGREHNDYRRRYLIVANPVEELHLVDEVVLKRSEGGFYQLGVWKVGADKGWTVFYQGPSQAQATSMIKVSKEGQPPGRLEDFFSVLGVVIAAVNVRRRVVYVPPDATLKEDN